MSISYKKFDGYDGYKYRSGFNVLKNMSMLKDIITKYCWSPIVWKNNYAKTDNFLESSFLALDFDSPGEESMEDINRSLCDHKRIIATTRSHGIYKNGVTCDRFRLIVPFSRPITDYAEYRYNYTLALKKYPWADKSCLDGARFFFPSREIVYFDRESEYTWCIVKPLPTTDYRLPTTKTQKQMRRIPGWCLRFINDGTVLNGSRNMTLLGVCCELFSVGFLESEVRQLIIKSNINWDGVNLEAIIKSAKKKELKNG